MSDVARVSIFGAGKLGSCLAAILAANKTQVIACDVDEGTVELLNAGKPPVDETGLEDLMALAHPWLRATTDVPTAIENSDIAFVVVPTPSGRDGRFSNEYVIDVLNLIGASLRRDTRPWFTVVIVSTVMPGAMRGPLTAALEESSGRQVGINVGLAYNPAFIALGSVISDFVRPDMVLIGTDDLPTAHSVRRVLARVVQEEPTWLQLSLIDAEIAKLTINAALVIKVGLANTVAELCESMPGADARQVLRAVGADSRIGPKYLQPGGHAAGPCLPRDCLAWWQAAADVDVKAPLIQAAHHVNKHQAQRIATKVAKEGRVAILGTAYKPLTSVTDQSLGLLIANQLNEWEIPVETFDPVARSPLPTWQGTAQELVDWADTVIVTTAWSEFAGLDYGAKRVIDVWGILPFEDNIERIGVGE